MTYSPDIVRTIFLRAVEGYAPEQWDAYLDEVCGDDAELRARVVELLESHRQLNDKHDERGQPPTILESAPSCESVGANIGPYRLLQQIGEGGMGVVYMAEQSAPVRRKVALKIIKAGMDTREVVARFEAERQALALMDHPNIARVFDGGATETGRPFFVMELVRGVPITNFCDQNSVPVHERLELFVIVCHAVQHAHQKGVIHRDIKPSNVLVTLHDGRPVPKVIDFGVAKAIGQPLTDKTLFTQFAQMVGTPLYMSPEQAEMTGLDVDTRGDVYSLGVLLYELLTGTTPLERGRMKKAAVEEIRRMIRDDDPPSPSTRLSRTSGEAQTVIAANRRIDARGLSRMVRGDLDWIVMKALEKDRTRRYETANGFAADLVRHLCDEPVEARPPSSAYRLQKFALRNRGAFATLALVFLALVIGTAVSTWQALRATHAETLSNDRLLAVTKAQGLAVAAQADAERAQQDEFEQRKIAEQRKNEAEGQRAEAQRQSGIAQLNENRARVQELLAQRRFYASQIGLAHQAAEAGKPARVLELLEGLRPRFDELDLRTFEWFYLWRLCHPGRQLDWQTQQGQITSVTFSPDGTQVAAGGDILKVWDATTGKERTTFKQFAAICVAFSPDGTSLCAGSWKHWDSPLKLWDVATVRELNAFPGEFPSIVSVAYSHDGATLATGTHVGSVLLWDVATRQLRRTIDAHSAHALVAFSPDDSLLATASWYSDKRTKVWELGPDPPRLLFDQDGATCVAFSPDGRTIAAGNRLWDVGTSQPKLTLNGHQGVVQSVAFSPDGRTVATAGLDRMVRLWDADTGKERASQAHTAPLSACTFSPDGKLLATGSTEGVLKIWDMMATPNPQVLPLPAVVRSIAFSPDGTTLVTAGDFPTRIWDVAAGKEREVFAVTGRGALSPDWTMFAGPGAEHCIKFYTAKTGAERANFQGHTNEVMCFAFSPDSKTLATGSVDHTVKLWDLATQTLRATLRPATVAGVTGGAVSAVAFSNDGKTLATGSQFNRVRLWNLSTLGETIVLQEHSDRWVRAIAFAPGDSIVAVGNDHGHVRLWNTNSGQQLSGGFQGHTDEVRSLAFSPDGLTLATGSEDATVRIWDVTSGQERMTFSDHRGPVTTVAFAPDGTKLASGSWDGTVRLWHADSDAMAIAVKDELGPKDADSPRADNALGDRLRDVGRNLDAGQAYRHAIERLDRLASRSPNVAAYAQERARSHLGLSFVLRIGGMSGEGQHEHDRAMSLLEEAAVQFPNAFDHRGKLARAYFDLGVKFQTLRQIPNAELAFNEAKTLYEALGVTFPTNTTIHRALTATLDRLARLFTESARPREAVEAYDKVIARAPQSAQGHNNLAWLLATCPETEIRNIERALELANRAVEINPREHSYWNTLGVAQYRCGKWEAAISSLQRVDVLLPDSPPGINSLFLAMAHWQQGEKDEARQLLRRVVEWVNAHPAESEGLRRFLTEAKDLLQ